MPPEVEVVNQEPSNPAPATINLQIAAESPKKEKDSGWTQLLNSTVLAAAVTALIGGVAANLAVAKFQSDAREREQELTFYRQNVDKQQEVILRAYDLISDAVADAEAMIDLTSPHMDPNNTLPAQRPDLLKQRQELMTRHNVVAQAWSKEHVKIGSLLTYYHPGATLVYGAWAACRKTVDAYRACSNEHYMRYRNDPRVTSESTSVCTNERAEVDTSVQELTRALDSARQSPWNASQRKQQTRSQ